MIIGVVQGLLMCADVSGPRMCSSRQVSRTLVSRSVESVALQNLVTKLLHGIATEPH